MDEKEWNRLLGIPGFEAERVEYGEEDGLNRVTIHLRRTKEQYVCRCGRKYTTYWDKTRRLVRDKGCWDWSRAYVEFDLVRINCRKCGVKTETLPWLNLWGQYTSRLAVEVAKACREIRAISSIAEQYGLKWHVVKEIDKASLKAELDPPDFRGVTRIAVDEIAIRKGQKYATMVIDFDKHRVLWVSEDRKKESLDEFYKKLGTEGCKKIVAVGMDMWEPFRASTHEYCKNADIVYDPFHVVMNYGKVINKVRNKEVRKTPKKNGRSSWGRSTFSSRTARTSNRRSVYA